MAGGVDSLVSLWLDRKVANKHKTGTKIMDITTRVERNNKGELNVTLEFEVSKGNEYRRDPYQYPNTLTNVLTGAAGSSVSSGCKKSTDGGLFSEGIVEFYFSPLANSAPVLVDFTALPLPNPLDPSCTPQEADEWAKKYTHTLIQRIRLVEYERTSQNPIFTVAYTASI